MAKSSSFYDVLEVERSATFDEIKVAFKKRALQVHPDKGGSKEAFHLVYEALETLADPEARKKYDQNLTMGQAVLHQSSQGCKKKTSSKTNCPAAPKASHRKAQGSTGPAASEIPKSKQAKLLTRIRDLLKQLPRDVRNDVLTKQFSQKQRLILEKFMVDASSGQQSAPDVRSMAVLGSRTSSGRESASMEQSPKNLQGDAACHINGEQSSSVLTMEVVQKRRWRPGKRKVKRKKPEGEKRVRSMCGAVCKESGFSAVSCYRARIRFDSLEMYTRKCNLQTAVEYLVVLTSVKQKMQEASSGNNQSASFEDRLQEALFQSSKGHGLDLHLRFVVLQAAGFLVAPGFMIRTPKVRSVEQLGKLRRLLEPFRQYAQYTGRQNLFSKYSPAHLQEAWGRFQETVAEAWRIAGVDGSPFLEKMRALHVARGETRTRYLQAWERHNMAMQDKNQHRPKRLRDKADTEYIEASERRRMAMEDKHEHRPKRLRVPLHKRVPEDVLASNLLALQKLLVPWDRLLRKEQRMAAEKVRRQSLQKKKKDRKEQRRQEILKQRQLREEERCRREALRKRMKMDLTMDDILGPPCRVQGENEA